MVFKGVGVYVFMKLTNKEVKQIAKIYDLGKVKSIKLFSDGWVNFNFALKTDKGKYVIRVLGKKYDRDKGKISDMEFGTLDYLNKGDFPYRVPLPIRTNDGKILIKLNGKKIWVYEMLPGKSKNPITIRKKPIKETAKAMAIYHKYIRNYSGKKVREENLLKGLDEKYRIMARVKPKDEADRLMLQNLDMFVKILKKVKKMKFDTEKLMTHSDFTTGNLLYDNKDKVVGIIDFEVASYSPKCRDLGHSMKSMCKKKGQKKEFINIYKKYNKLSKKEERLLPWITMRDNCSYFALFYKTEPTKGVGKKDKMEKKLTLMNWVISSTKGLLDGVEI